MLQLILAEDAGEIAKSGDTITLKDDGTYSITKEFATEKPKEETKEKPKEETKEKPKEESKNQKEEIDKKVEKYLTNDQVKAWEILTKFYNNKHFDSTKVLKHVISKMAVCPDITEKFDDLMTKWMSEGEADISPIEKIINSCKQEGGNVKKSIEIIDNVMKIKSEK